jgi:hypothetical protein
MKTVYQSISKILLCSICAIIMQVNTATAQDRSMHEIQAAIIYNVIKYIQWSNEIDGKASFVFGVFGDDQLYNTLSNAYQSKLKGSKKISVSKLNSADEAPNCDLFFLGQSKLKDFQRAKDLITNKPTLYVTSADTYGKKGANVNLTSEQNKMIIEINEPSIEESGFRVAGALLSMARVIK